MKHAILPDNVTIRPAELDVQAIIVRERQRAVADDHVELLQASIAQTGKQIVPIAVSERPGGKLVLIDGAHRLEAAKRDGRTTIRAEVYTGLDEEHENVLEFVTNRARRDLSPAEIHAAWETFELPLYELKAREKQSLGGHMTAVATGKVEDSMLIPAGNKHESATAVSIRSAAIEKTGHKPEWLDKVRRIRDLAASEEAPAPVREAAQRGWEKLHDSKAKVEPVFKQVQKIHEAVLHEQEDPVERKRRAAEKRLDEVVRDTTLLQERLEGDLRDVLMFAARQGQMGRDMLRAARVALVHALTQIVVVECEVDGNPTVNLRTIGSEVTNLLSQQSMRALGLSKEGTTRD
ncbi:MULTISPECIES: ParB/RepB/Spo0J family partition protein [unclassified Leucobacter]|uniref:ParB/RepB/Spo0J family partition protein n=1 Tax=unclassified Leucobacter TaxID=2621730 RepID=UPI0030187363